METQNVKLVADASGKESAATIRVEVWDKKSRTRRAIRLWVICWGAMILAVFLPLVHFVLVPGLLLAGPIGAKILYGQEKIVLGGDGKCPECGADFQVAKSSYKFPISDLCTKCRKVINIHLNTQN